jgi:hypothetical protein
VDVSHLPKGMYLLIDAKYDSEKEFYWRASLNIYCLCYRIIAHFFSDKAVFYVIENPATINGVHIKVKGHASTSTAIV